MSSQPAQAADVTGQDLEILQSMKENSDVIRTEIAKAVILASEIK